MKCLVEAILSLRAAHEYLLIMPPAAADAVDDSAHSAEKLISSAKYYSLREQIEVPWILRRHSVSLLHSPHFMLPLVRPCPAVVTIHDVIYLACKEDLPSHLGRLYYGLMMSAAARQAARIITDSEFSKRDILRYLGADAEKIEVIYPGVSRQFQPIRDPALLRGVRGRHKIQRDYILYTGIYKPRKNHEGLLQAFQRFLELGGDADLVIAGPMKEGEERLVRLAGELGISARLKLTGFVDDDALCALYSGARVYGCPSLYEGFGFTVLEAMACGAPVVCSAETSLPEVAGNAAYYANARDPQEFGAALLRVFTDPALRTELITKGRENLRRFCWMRAAGQTIKVYEDACTSVPQGIEHTLPEPRGTK